MSTKISNNTVLYKALKLRILPDQDQTTLIHKTFGCCRQIFNTRLQENIEFYTNNILLIPKEDRKSKSKEIWKQFKPKTEKELKQEFEYLKEVSSTALQQSRMNCETAFQNFYKGLKSSRKVGFPKYKSKKQSRQSYREVQVLLNHFDYSNRRLQIPKLGKVHFKSHNLPKWFSYVDISWGNFVSKLQRKGTTYNCQVIKADRFFDSSQTCNNCGFKYPEVQKKHLETWICPNCGSKHQRDVNAAINLKHYVPIERRKLTTVDSVEELARLALA